MGLPQIGGGASLAARFCKMISRKNIQISNVTKTDLENLSGVSSSTDVRFQRVNQGIVELFLTYGLIN